LDFEFDDLTVVVVLWLSACDFKKVRGSKIGGEELRSVRRQLDYTLFVVRLSSFQAFRLFLCRPQQQQQQQ
jgi:hypothetical protein